MSVTESVSSFKGFSDVYPSCKNLTHALARLFNKCDDQEETLHDTISFREATERLQAAVEISLSGVEVNTRRVSEFRIGKTSVTSQENPTFDPMKPTTWIEAGGIIGKWREHLQDDYDGLFEVGCVTTELIPSVIKETNTAIGMDHQMYALGMAQALVHHYMVHQPDARLRNKSFDIGNWSEGKIGDTGGIIYVAYKLESYDIQADSLVIKKEEQEGAHSIAVLNDKGARATEEDETFEASTIVPIQGAIHEKILKQAHKGEKITVEKISDEEKTLINLFKGLAITDGWKKVTEKVFENRHQYLSKKSIEYYEYMYHHENSKLTTRIYDFARRDKRDSGGKLTD